jgi:hypothetical protein
MSLNSSSQKSVLLIGATGKTGLAILDQLDEHTSKPSVHILCRDPANLSQEYKTKCVSIVKGNARINYDIEQGLKKTQADWVIICVGKSERIAKNDSIRTVSAEATVSVLKKPKYSHVRALVVSTTGAGSSSIVVGLGIGRLISYKLKHVLDDYTGQEIAFSQIRDRTTIVRATALTNDKPTGNLAYFGDTSKGPSIKTARADLAKWIAEEVCSDKAESRVVNVTSVKPVSLVLQRSLGLESRHSRCRSVEPLHTRSL